MRFGRSGKPLRRTYRAAAISAWEAGLEGVGHLEAKVDSTWEAAATSVNVAASTPAWSADAQWTPRALVSSSWSAAATTLDASAYSNNYLYRRRIRIPSTSGVSSGFPLLVAITDANLKSVANGGKVVSSSGFDIRFEDENGTKLKHILDTYVDTTGQIRAFVLLNSDAASALFMYFGKTGISGTEADSAGATASCLVYYNPVTGTDLTGLGRTATATAVTATTIGAIRAGAYDGSTSGMVTADASSWLGGKTALHIHCVVQATTANVDRTILCYGDGVSGSDITQGLVLRYSAGVVAQTGANVIRAVINLGSSNYVYLESTASMQTTAAQTLDFYWASGSLPELWVNGVKDTGAWAGKRVGATYTKGSTLTGSITSLVQGLRIGQGNAGRWNGAIGDVELRAANATAMAAGRYLNITDHDMMFGMGAADTPASANRSPVALPDFFTLNQNAPATLFNVLANDIDPDADTRTIASVDTVTGGTASVASGQVSFLVTNGFTGIASFYYTVSDPSGITSRTKARVTVSASAGLAGLPYDGLGFGCDAFCINNGNFQLSSATLWSSYSFEAYKTGTLTHVLVEIACNQNSPGNDEWATFKKSKGEGDLYILYTVYRGKAGGTGGAPSIPDSTKLIRTGYMLVDRGTLAALSGDKRRWRKLCVAGTAEVVSTASGNVTVYTDDLSGISVTKGEYIHFTFQAVPTTVDPITTATPPRTARYTPNPSAANNYCSINALTRYSGTTRSAFAPYGGSPPRVISPPGGDNRTYILRLNTVGGTPNRTSGHIPQITQYFSDGAKIGGPYRFGELQMATLGAVAGNKKCRQRWKHIYPTTDITKVWIYCHWTGATKPNAALTVTITQEGAGGWVQSATIAAANAPAAGGANTGSATEVQYWTQGYDDDTYSWWSYASFTGANKLTFTKDQTYEIKLTSSATVGQYQIHSTKEYATINVNGRDDDSTSTDWLWLENPSAAGEGSRAQYSTTAVEAWSNIFSQSAGGTDNSFCIWFGVT